MVNIYGVHNAYVTFIASHKDGRNRYCYVSGGMAKK